MITIFKYLQSIGLVLILLLFIFLLDPYSLAIKSGYAMLVAILIFKGKSFFYNIDKSFLAIIAFSVTYSMFDYFGENRGIQFLIIQATFPPFFYALGKMMITSKVSGKGIVSLFLIIGFVYSITALLSIIFNLVEGGFIQTNRFIPSFWDGKDIKSTKMASYLIYNSVIPAILVANWKKYGIPVKVVLLIIFGVSLIASFRLGSRTLIGISALSLTVSFLYILFKQKLLDNLKLVFTVLALLIVIYLFVPIDWNSPIFSTLGHRFRSGGAIESVASAGSRTELWAAGLKKLFENPLGWKYHMYHHNLWLDMAKNAGFIPLLFFLVSNVFCYSSIKKAFKITGVDIGFNVTILVYFIATFLLFFTEPVIEGNYFSIVIYCLLIGILNGFIKNRMQPDAT